MGSIPVLETLFPIFIMPMTHATSVKRSGMVSDPPQQTGKPFTGRLCANSQDVPKIFCQNKGRCIQKKTVLIYRRELIPGMYLVVGEVDLERRLSGQERTVMFKRSPDGIGIDG